MAPGRSSASPSAPKDADRLIPFYAATPLSSLGDGNSWERALEPGRLRDHYDMRLIRLPTACAVLRRVRPVQSIPLIQT